MPKLGENALLKMGAVLERFASRQPSLAPTAEPLAFLRGVGEDEHDPAAALARLERAGPAAAHDARADVRRHVRANQDPRLGEDQRDPLREPSCASTAACRPVSAKRETRRAIEQVLGGLRGPRIEFTERVTGNRSPIDSPLMDALGEWIASATRASRTVPTVLPGFTDSRHFRAAFPECVAYGFFPQRHQSLLETQALIHAPDERIDVRDLAFASELYRDLAVRMLA